MWEAFQYLTFYFVWHFDAVDTGPLTANTYRAAFAERQYLLGSSAQALS